MNRNDDFMVRSHLDRFLRILEKGDITYAWLRRKAKVNGKLWKFVFARWAIESYKVGVLIQSSGRKLCAAGWVMRPHTPPTKSGKTVVFFSLEDETGLLNVTVFPSVYEKYGHLIFSHPLLLVEGRKIGEAPTVSS